VYASGYSARIPISNTIEFKGIVNSRGLTDNAQAFVDHGKSPPRQKDW
jgi:hypothetical protein